MTANKHIRYAIGADIGGSHLSSAVVDLQSGELITRPITTPVNSRASAMEIAEAWASNLLASAEASPEKVVAAGLAIPGPFDYTGGVSLISGVGKYDSIFGLDLPKTLPAMLAKAGIGKLRFVNDASAFALGECLGGAATDDNRVMALTLGTGVGSGFVASGKLVESGDTVPANGWVYCLPFGEGIADEAFSTRWIVNRYRQLTGVAVAGAKDVADLCQYDPAARQLFEEYGCRLADFAAPLLRQFRSDTLLLGGNISRAYTHFGKALANRFDEKDCKVNVKVSTLLDNAALVGAASLFI